MYVFFQSTNPNRRINPHTRSKMYRLRYPVVSGGESGFAAASGAATDMSFIVGDNLPQRQAGVGSYILIRHWKGTMSSSQRSKSTRRSKKRMTRWREEQRQNHRESGRQVRQGNSGQSKR